MQESFSIPPNSLINSAAGRRMPKPSLILQCTPPPQIKAVIYRVQAKACAPLETAVSSSWSNHGAPVCEGMPSFT